MKTERAIELLHRLQDEQFDGIHGDERREALDMAVRALEQNLVQESGDLVKELVNDCISRQAVKEWLTRWEGYIDADIIARMQCRVIDIPSAQTERKKGKWINAYPDIEPNPMFMYGICSVCGFEQAISNKLNFCPNCGADMRGEIE